MILKAQSSIETLDGLIKHNGPVKDFSKLNRILEIIFLKKLILI